MDETGTKLRELAREAFSLAPQLEGISKYGSWMGGWSISPGDEANIMMLGKMLELMAAYKDRAHGEKLQKLIQDVERSIAEVRAKAGLSQDSAQKMIDILHSLPTAAIGE